MKNGRMQAKDVPDRPILEFIHEVHTNGVIYIGRKPTDWGHGERWHHVTWFSYDEGFIPANSVQTVVPPGTPEKVVLAKMRRLIARGLVDGCPCGCRGDYELTDAGRAMIEVATSPGKAGQAYANEQFNPDTFEHAFRSMLGDWSREMLTLTYPQFVARMHPEPIATIGTTPMFSDDMMQALADAGITVEYRGQRTILNFPRSGAIDGRALQQALDPGITRLSADDLFFPVTAPAPPPGPSYLQHDPTKSFRRRRRGR